MAILIPSISHGHGLSFKKGVTDALLEENRFKNDLPNGHFSSYQQGYELGESLKNEVASKVKPNHVGK